MDVETKEFSQNNTPMSNSVFNTYQELISESVKVAASNGIAVKPRNDEVAKGSIAGSSTISAYGKKTTTGSTALGLLWADGTFYVPVEAGEQMRFVSTSAQDGVAGTGIRSLHVHYLDADLNPQTETVVLNGTTPVLSVATNIRFIQCGHLATYGTNKSAVGTITITDLGGTKTYNQVAAGELRCTSSARMCPKGKRIMVEGLVGSSVSGTAAASTIINICVSKFFEQDYTQDAILIPMASTGLQDNSTTFVLPVPLVVYEGTIVGMTCSTDKAAIITGAWFGILEDV